MSGQPARQLAWCAAAQPLPSRWALGSREPLQFEDPQAFTRWLFRQPRGAITPSTVLVVGWAEAKPCMHVIKAARTGDVAKLRPDKGRPQLPEATPGVGDNVTNVAVAEVVILAKDEMARRRAEKWLREGEYDEHVRIGVVSGEEQLQAALLRAAPPVSNVHGAGAASSGRGRDNATEGARRRWASISSSSARSQSPSDCARRGSILYASVCLKDAAPTPPKPGSSAKARGDGRRDAATAAGSPAVHSACPPALAPEDQDEPWMMAYTRSPPAVSESVARRSARARTPSPDYMWPGFSTGALSPGLGRDFRRMAAQEACKVRTPSPDYMWPGFSAAKPRVGKSGSADAGGSAADTVVGFVLSV